MNVKSPRKRSAEGDEEFVDPALCGWGTGALHDLIVYDEPKKGVKKRPIGFCRDIDKLEDAD